MIEWNRRGTIAALGALVVALLLFGVALARAVLLEPGPADSLVQAATEPIAAAETAPAAPLVPSEAKLSAGDIELAVDHDPFQPDRTRAAPYRLPGEDVPTVASAPEAPAAPQFIVTGLVQLGDGGLALVQLPDQTSQVIGIGESVLGYRLERVGATSATVYGDGRTLEMELTSASQARAGDSSNAQQTAADAIREALQRRGIPALLQAERSGLSVEQLQQMREQMGGRGGRGGRGTIRRDTTGGGGR